jgi:hypothetical protein
MDLKIGDNLPQPEGSKPEERKTQEAGAAFFGEKKTVIKVSSSKDELYAYISQSPTGELESLLTRKIVPQQLVDAEFLNRLAKGNELAPLKMFLAYAKESLLYIGLLTILKNASVDSTLLVIRQLKSIPPKAPFEIFKNFSSDPEGCLKIFSLLVEKGWDPKSKNDAGENLIDLAIKQGYSSSSPFYQELLKLGTS